MRVRIWYHFPETKNTHDIYQAQHIVVFYVIAYYRNILNELFRENEVDCLPVWLYNELNTEKGINTC